MQFLHFTITFFLTLSFLFVIYTKHKTETKEHRYKESLAALFSPLCVTIYTFAMTGLKELL